MKKSITLYLSYIIVILSQAYIGHAEDISLDEILEYRKTSAFKSIRASIEGSYERIIEDTIRLTEIPAPSFGEAEKSKLFVKLMREAGLKEVGRDEAGNAYGLRRGSGTNGIVAIVAHLDTVFPKDTPLKVRRKGNRLYAPGVGDDTVSLAIMLAYIKALDAAYIHTASDLLFVGSVGEEGIGDLKGVKHLFNEGPFKDKIKYMFAFEALPVGELITTAIGSVRYDVTFSGPGGHSFADFGIVNPAYAMANAIVEFSNINIKGDAKTTYSIGTVSGGTAVNVIPRTVSMEVDMRSENQDQLDRLEHTFLKIIEKAVAKENQIRSTLKGSVTYKPKLISIRPGGKIERRNPIIQHALAAFKAGHLEPKLTAASTDANFPISIGIPAITIGHGITSHKAHSLEEYIELNPENDVNHMATTLTAILSIAGAI